MGLLLLVGSAFPQIAFQDATNGSGIQYTGSAWSAAWRDYDNDGDPDLWTTNHGGKPTLYLNQGQGRFVKAPEVLLKSAVRDGHGAAWADLDNDGDADLVEVTGAVLGSGAGANQLFINEAGKLRDKAREFGVDYPLGRGRISLWLDYDNDSLLDLLIMNQSRHDRQAPSALFHNEKGHFRVVTQEVGLDLDQTANDAFVLLTDLDGQLPMEVVIFGLFPAPFTPRAFTIEKGLFKEITPFPGKPVSHVFDAISGDFNGDLRPDLLLIRYRYSSDILQLDKTRLRAALFNNGTQVRGLDIHTSGKLKLALHLPTVKWNFDDFKVGAHQKTLQPLSTKIISGFFDLDAKEADVQGAPEIRIPRKRAIYLWFDARTKTWKLRFTSQSWAFLQLEIISSQPIDATEPVGFRIPPPLQPLLLLSTDQGFIRAPLPKLPSCSSAATADFDNDGDLDLYLVCTLSILNQPNLLLKNDGKGNFQLVQKHGAEGTLRGVGQKAAIADYDNDGYPDLFVINGLGPASPLTRGPYQLFHNLGGNNHWLKVDLEGTTSNKDAIGAQVLVTTGDTTQLREQSGMSHYGAQDDRLLHFGLGRQTSVKEMKIRWPDGTMQILENIPADQILHVRQPVIKKTHHRP